MKYISLINFKALRKRSKILNDRYFEKLSCMKPLVKFRKINTNNFLSRFAEKGIFTPLKFVTRCEGSRSNFSTFSNINLRSHSGMVYAKSE